jgi:methyl-accepting chemotaxis protein
MRISRKVFGGFSAVLVLLLIVAVTGVVGLTSADGYFEDYRLAARQRAAVNQTNIEISQTRVAAKSFVITGDEAAAKSAHSNLAELSHAITAARSLAEGNASLAARIDEIDRHRQTYQAAFDQVASRQKEIDQILRGTLDHLGPDLEGLVTTISATAAKANNADAAYQAGNVLRSVLLMRLSVLKFMAEHDQKAFTAFKDNAAEAEKLLAGLTAGLTVAENQQTAAKAKEKLRTYIDAATRMNNLVSERETLITTKMDQVGPVVTALADDISKTLAEVQDRLGPLAQAANTRTIMITIVVAVAAAVLAMLAAWAIGSGISGPVTAMTSAMTVLANGDKSVIIPGTDHGDEIGDMAKAVQVFKDNMVRNEQMAAEQERERLAREARTDKIEGLTKHFDSSAAAVLNTVASAATELQSTASSMTAVAEQTSRQATAVAAAAEEASSNVQTVAAATEELSSSIGEISRQVTESARIASSAVDEAKRTDAMVMGLSEAAGRIGEVVNLITNIASQTNLLALNATIEAARAGEAGKGFAVVANEVKNLANQTAKATDEIGSQIGAVQSATQSAVAAIRGIGQTIARINEIATTIASAVEQQGAATHEIARNVQQASEGTQDVSNNIAGVTQASEETGHAASDVLNASNELSRQAEALRHLVQQFLADVRTA